MDERHPDNNNINPIFNRSIVRGLSNILANSIANPS